MSPMRELPWHLAYLAILLAGNVILVLAADDWPVSAQVSFLVSVLGLTFAVLLLGRERTRRPHR